MVFENLRGFCERYLVKLAQNDTQRQIYDNLSAGGFAGAPWTSVKSDNRRVNGGTILGYGVSGSGSVDASRPVPLFFDNEGTPVMRIGFTGMGIDAPDSDPNFSTIGSHTMWRPDNNGARNRYMDSVKAAYDWYVENGITPRIDVFGHSRGGGAALQFARDWYGRTNVPIDNVVGLDPFNRPLSEDEDGVPESELYMDPRTRLSPIIRQYTEFRGGDSVVPFGQRLGNVPSGTSRFYTIDGTGHGDWREYIDQGLRSTGFPITRKVAPKYVSPIDMSDVGEYIYADNPVQANGPAPAAQPLASTQIMPGISPMTGGGGIPGGYYATRPFM